jgi:hypothetical protein
MSVNQWMRKIENRMCSRDTAAVTVSHNAEDSSGGFVAVAWFTDWSEAMIAKSIMESASIQARLPGDGTVLSSRVQGLEPGVKLFVHESDREAAVQILRAQFPESCV